MDLVSPMSVVRVMRGVGVREMCMCWTRAGVGAEGRVNERIGFGLYQSCWKRGCVGRVCVWVA